MSSLILTLLTYAIPCGTPQVVINPGQSWNPADSQMIAKAGEGCRRHFGETACLTVLIKTGNLSWQAICSKQHKKASNK